jgi:hypothetical protein
MNLQPTSKQINLLSDLCFKLNQSPDLLAREMYGVRSKDLTRYKLSQLIDHLVELRANQVAIKGWRRCNSRNRCPVCGRRKYCSVTADGKFAVCTKSSIGSISETKDGHYVHRLTSLAVSHRIPVVKPSKQLPPEEVEEQVNNYSVVYSALIALSPASISPLLMDGHKGLNERGLSSSAHMYGMLPGSLKERQQLAQRIIEYLETLKSPLNEKRDYKDLILGTPGFWEDNNNQLMIWIPDDYKYPSLIIPYRDIKGRIQGCQLRLYDPSSSSRYQWLSSASFVKDGPSPGTPIHFVQNTISTFPRKNLIIEGALKADACGNIPIDSTITATSGVSCAHSKLGEAALLITQKVEPVIIAFDQDHSANAKVCRQMSRLIRGLQETNLKPLVLVWNGKYNGIDECILDPDRTSKYSILDPVSWLNSLTNEIASEAIKEFKSLSSIG